MSFESYKNIYLIVRSTVELTPTIDPVIRSLDEYFQRANLRAYVTSGLRHSGDQLRIIKNELVKLKLIEKYPDEYTDPDKRSNFAGKPVYAWAPGWSALLNAGFVVNPPRPAEVLMDYIRPGSKVNRKGSIIQPSFHFKGTAFDIGGGDQIEAEEAVIKSAIGKVKGLKGYLLERNNNAIHIDCL